MLLFRLGLFQLIGFPKIFEILMVFIKFLDFNVL